MTEFDYELWGEVSDFWDLDITEEQCIGCEAQPLMDNDVYCKECRWE